MIHAEKLQKLIRYSDFFFFFSRKAQATESLYCSIITITNKVRGIEVKWPLPTGHKRVPKKNQRVKWWECGDASKTGQSLAASSDDGDHRWSDIYICIFVTLFISAWKYIHSSFLPYKYLSYVLSLFFLGKKKDSFNVTNRCKLQVGG